MDSNKSMAKVGGLEMPKHLPENDTSTNCWYLHGYNFHLDRPSGLQVKYLTFTIITVVRSVVTRRPLHLSPDTGCHLLQSAWSGRHWQ